MFQRIITLLIAAPIAVFLIMLAVINRQNATLILDPFKPAEPAIALTMPFYLYLFGALALGILAGGLSVWFSQGRWRSAARVRTQEARRWQAEADRLARERDANVGQSGISQSLGQSKELALLNR